MDEKAYNAPALAPCAGYDPETVRSALERVIEAAGGLDWVKPGMRIGIKLNDTSRPGRGADADAQGAGGGGRARRQPGWSLRRAADAPLL